MVPTGSRVGAARADEDGLVVDLEEMAARHQRHLPVRDERVVLGRADEREVDRERDDRDPDPQDRVRDVAPKALFFDHQ